MSEQDQQQRDVALDLMMTEGRQLIEQLNEAATRLSETLSEVGDKNAIGDFLKSDQCPEGVRKDAQEDHDKLMQELEQEEQVLASESRGSASQKSTRKSRPGMNRI